MEKQEGIASWELVHLNSLLDGLTRIALARYQSAEKLQSVVQKQITRAHLLSPLGTPSTRSSDISAASPASVAPAANGETFNAVELVEVEDIREVWRQKEEDTALEQLLSCPFTAPQARVPRFLVQHAYFTGFLTNEASSTTLSNSFSARPNSATTPCSATAYTSAPTLANASREVHRRLEDMYLSILATYTTLNLVPQQQTQQKQQENQPLVQRIAQLSHSPPPRNLHCTALAPFDGAQGIFLAKEQGFLRKLVLDRARALVSTAPAQSLSSTSSSLSSARTPSFAFSESSRVAGEGALGASSRSQQQPQRPSPRLPGPFILVLGNVARSRKRFQAALAALRGHCLAPSSHENGLRPFSAPAPASTSSSHLSGVPPPSLGSGVGPAGASNLTLLRAKLARIHTASRSGPCPVEDDASAASRQHEKHGVPSSSAMTMPSPLPTPSSSSSFATSSSNPPFLASLERLRRLFYVNVIQRAVRDFLARRRGQRMRAAMRTAQAETQRAAALALLARRRTEEEAKRRSRRSAMALTSIKVIQRWWRRVRWRNAMTRAWESRLMTESPVSWTPMTRYAALNYAPLVEAKTRVLHKWSHAFSSSFSPFLTTFPLSASTSVRSRDLFLVLRLQARIRLLLVRRRVHGPVAVSLTALRALRIPSHEGPSSVSPARWMRREMTKIMVWRDSKAAEPVGLSSPSISMASKSWAMIRSAWVRQRPHLQGITLATSLWAPVSAVATECVHARIWVAERRKQVEMARTRETSSLKSQFDKWNREVRV